MLNSTGCKIKLQHFELTGYAQILIHENKNLGNTRIKVSK